MTTPLSVLDLASVTEGASSADAIADSIALAEAADRLGYHRFWTAEHHNMPAVAATSPAVLLAALTARTTRIRLGSGGVMLPNHSPLVVAEQFALLETLAPGRIDLGLGRAPGTDPVTARALRGGDLYGTVEDFPQHLQELMAMLGRDRERAAGLARGLFPTPVPVTHPQLWVLGSSTYGAHAAAALGLPYTFAHHFGTGTDVLAAAAAYRDHFTASDAGETPRLMVTASVIIADSPAEADWIDRTARMQRVTLLSNRLAPLQHPDDIVPERMDDVVRGLYARVDGTQYRGTAETVVPALRELVERTGADELMVTGSVFDVRHRERTLRELIGAWD